MKLNPVSEGTSFTLTVALKDANGAALVPTTCHYRVDCLTTGTTVRDWTAVVPGASMPIAVDSADTAIVSDGSSREQRQITLVADRGLATQYVPAEHYLFWVYNVLAGRDIQP